MPEHPRIACCIVGCGRTMRRYGDYHETMCSRHYRADQHLLKLYKEATATFRKLYRWRIKKGVRWLMAKRGRSFKVTSVEAAHRRAIRRWDMIKENSQRLQDAGFFAPRPRRKRCDPAPREVRNRIDNAFEREFQRAKAAQQIAKG